MNILLVFEPLRDLFLLRGDFQKVTAMVARDSRA